MTFDPRHLALRLKLALLISGLLALIAVFLLVYFPTRIEGFSRRWAERRAVGVATLMARASEAGLEFDDSKTVTELLKGLGEAPEVVYAVVRRNDGTLFAGWKSEQAAPFQVVKELAMSTTADELRVELPIHTRGGVSGWLAIGFSLRELEAEKHEIRWLVGSASGVVFLVGLLASLFIGTLIVRPVERMTEVAQRIARGDLSQEELDVRGGDEIGRMASAFNQMLRSLRELAAAADKMASGDLTVVFGTEGQAAAAFNRMVEGQRTVVRELGRTAAQLGGAAAEIQAAARGQESMATKQAAGVEEVSRTMQSLLDSAAHIAESARGVLSNAERTKVTADSTAGRIAELSTHTNRIAELLEVIRDIADRSDLLALNASLEATRAGEAGRSFSLVAGEMRRLAERVTATVGDVKSLVNDVRTSGTTTVLATEEGRKLADGTTESARQITLVTQQQRSATEQVSESMGSISALLTQSVASAAQTRSAAEVLKTQAEQLSSIVGRFHLGEPVAARQGTAPERSAAESVR